jgi:putative phosphoesterase
MTGCRLALLADIHGNRPAFRAVMQKIHTERLDGIIFAGDLIGGPHDEEIFADLYAAGAKIPVYLVRGNAEDYIARIEDGTAPPEWHHARQFAMVRWIFSRLSEPFRDAMRRLPARLSIELPGTAPITVFHGTPGSRNEHLRPAINPTALGKAFAAVEEDVLICGHSHEQWLERSGERMALSPGAVCAPLDGQVGAAYAMLEWNGKQWQAGFHAVPYCFDEFARDMQDSGLLETGYLARAHLMSIYCGSDWGTRFLRHAGALAMLAGVNLPYIPDEIWERAGQTFFA